MTWRKIIEQEWERRRANDETAPLLPLTNNNFDAREIIAAIDTLLTGRLTMADRVTEFENAFASHVGAPYAVMVNSGSSANLLALSAATNTTRSKRLHLGDEVLVPAVCWSTSVWPIVQCGLLPVFVDVDPATLNMNIDDARDKITDKTRAVIAVHILGNSTSMHNLHDMIENNNLILIEDTCESLSSTYLNKHLGTHGHFGTYSLYYSHHITSGEGGVVVCHTPEDTDLLRCLRAHGWSRELSDRKAIEADNPTIDPRFLFVNLGYNVRPMEIQAAFGLCQLQRVKEMNRARNQNREMLAAALRTHKLWGDQMTFPLASSGTDPIWFGFPFLLRRDLAPRKRDYASYLTRNGIENRPIVSGNFLRQPAAKTLGLRGSPQDFPGAEAVHEQGLFIGAHATEMPSSTIEHVADVMLSFWSAR